MPRNTDRSSSCPGRVPGSLSRRDALATASNGFGLLALSSLLADPAYGRNKSTSRVHFPPRAKNVIFCFMPGGVSQVDTFDPKPALTKHHDQAIGDWANSASKKSPGGPDRRWKRCPWEFVPSG